jgi:dTDP-4-dehydrorhamnose 3,5-epimerase
VIVTPLRLPGAFVFEPERIADARGFFARTWCAREAAALGLNTLTAQCSVSFNAKRGTLRGMHYQAPPDEEAKLVRCTAGAVYDVLLDMRAASPTFKQWVAVELTAANHLMTYIPEGVAHGFQTLAEDTEVFYQISQFYAPASARGVRWDDPAFKIDWPLPRPTISAKDAAYADFP